MEKKKTITGMAGEQVYAATNNYGLGNYATAKP